jgi:hypothetical protein
MAARTWFLALTIALSAILVVGCGGPPPTAQPSQPSPTGGGMSQTAAPGQTPAPAAPGRPAAPAYPATPAVALDQQLGNGAVTLKGYSLQKTPAGLTVIVLYWQDNKPVGGSYTALLHLFPQDVSLLTLDRRPYGFANMDHDAEVPTASWQPGRTYVSVHRGTLNPGTYHAFTGLYTNAAGKVSRLKPAKPAPPMKTEKDAVDLGKITIP